MLAHVALCLLLRERGHHLAGASVTQNFRRERERIRIFRVVNRITIAIEFAALILLGLLVQRLAPIASFRLLATLPRLVDRGHKVQLSHLLLLLLLSKLAQLLLPLLHFFTLVQKVIGELGGVLGNVGARSIARGVGVETGFLLFEATALLVVFSLGAVDEIVTVLEQAQVLLVSLFDIVR